MTQKTKNSPASNPNFGLIMIVIIIAVVAVIAVVAISSNTQGTASAEVVYGKSFNSLDEAISANVSTNDPIPQYRTADGGYVLGYPNAPITIVAFEDFLCPHCQQYKPVVNQLFEEYVATGKAKFEFRMLPTQSASPIAMGMAQCADEIEPGSFWTAHDMLFSLASKERFSGDTARKFANQIGISYTALLDCSENALQWQTDQALARELGVTGTPTVMIRRSPDEKPQSIGDTAPTFEALAVIIEASQNSTNQ